MGWNTERAKAIINTIANQLIVLIGGLQALVDAGSGWAVFKKPSVVFGAAMVGFGLLRQITTPSPAQAKSMDAMFEQKVQTLVDTGILRKP